MFKKQDLCEKERLDLIQWGTLSLPLEENSGKLLRKYSPMDSIQKLEYPVIQLYIYIYALNLTSIKHSLASPQYWTCLTLEVFQVVMGALPLLLLCLLTPLPPALVCC